MRKLKRMMQEAHAVSAESAATGIPIGEVSELRAARRNQNIAASREVVETYNDAAKRVRERGAREDHVAKALALENVHRVGRGQPPIARRHFLKLAGIAAAAFAARPRRAQGAQPQPRIAIVGGGLAGLRCAHKLSERGLFSTVYDAQTPGGCCETNRGYFRNNQIAEMHGEFISSEHTAVKDLGAGFSLELDDLWAYPTHTEDTYFFNGAIYTQSQLNADWKSFGYDVFHRAVQQVPAPQSRDAHSELAATWDGQDVRTWLTDHLPGGVDTNFGHMCLEATIGNFGGAPEDTSALNTIFMLGYNTSGNNRQYQPPSYPYVSGTDERWHFTGGNDQMVSGMIDELPVGSIQTGMALVALKDNGNSTYTLTFKRGASTIQVVANHVVLALPFKTLRNVDLKRARLSALKMTAINELGMGTSGKVIFQFNGHPWVKSGFDGNCLADSPTNWLWEMNYQPDNNNAPTGILVQYPGAGTTPDYVKKYRVTQDEGVPPAKMVNDILGSIEPIFPGCKAAYNGGLAWYHFGLNDPWLQGGYSYWRVGQITGFSGYERVPEGNIHFAGEHTSQDFQGYMEGALRSGERCALEISG